MTRLNKQTGAIDWAWLVPSSTKKNGYTIFCKLLLFRKEYFFVSLALRSKALSCDLIGMNKETAKKNRNVYGIRNTIFGSFQHTNGKRLGNHQPSDKKTGFWILAVSALSTGEGSVEWFES